MRVRVVADTTGFCYPGQATAERRMPWSTTQDFGSGLGSKGRFLFLEHHVAAKRGGRHHIEAPRDNYGRVYIGMLEDGTLSMHAKLCYGVMWSFAAQGDAGGCWAGLDAIAKRMTCSRPTVMKAQAELKAAGWIQLLEGSRGHATNYWTMVTPAVNAVDPSGKRRLPLAVNGVDTKQELNQARETTATATPSDALEAPVDQPKGPDLDPAPPAPAAPPVVNPHGEILGAYRAWWVTSLGAAMGKFVPGPGDGKLAQGLVKAGVTAEDVAAACAVWPAKADDYTKAEGFPFWLFCRAFNKLNLAAKAAAPACTHTAVNWTRTFGDGTRSGTCVACGAPITRRQGEGDVA